MRGGLDGARHDLPSIANTPRRRQSNEALTVVREAGMLKEQFGADPAHTLGEDTQLLKPPNAAMGRAESPTVPATGTTNEHGGWM